MSYLPTPDAAAFTQGVAPHVVHIIDELPPDGAERLIADIIANRSGKFRYSVVCLVAGGELAPEIAACGVPVTVLNCRRGIDWRTLPKIHRWLRRQNPQVVHTHLFAADTYGRVAALLAGIPVIVSTRHNINPWPGLFRRGIARALAMATSRTIACGAEVGRAMVERERMPAGKAVIIPNGINMKRLLEADRTVLRRELGVSADQLVLGVVGRLHAQKGHFDVLQALAALRDESGKWVCVFAGSGPLQQEIAIEIDRLALGRSVRLIGQRSDMPNVLAALDILVMPSRWEGLPMALLEGMSFGLPVVATRVGSVPDVIDHDRNGLLVAPAAPEELARELGRLLSEPDTRRRLGNEARETVVQRYDAGRTVHSYESLYLELLAA